jgi:hypothetical protein
MELRIGRRFEHDRYAATSTRQTHEARFLPFENEGQVALLRDYLGKEKGRFEAAFRPCAGGV